MPIRSVHASSASQPKPLTGATPASAAAKGKVLTPFGPVSLEAYDRIFGHGAPSPTIGRGQGKRLDVGEIDGLALEISASGRFLVGGKLPSSSAGAGADAIAIYQAARVASTKPKGLFSSLSMTSEMRGRVFTQLAAAIDHAQSGKRTKLKSRALAGAMALSLDLARSCPASDHKTKRLIIDRVLGSLSRERDGEMAAFYLQSMRELKKGMDATQVAAFGAIANRLMPTRPLVEEYTEGRTKPLQVRQKIHEEFWKEELAFYSKKNGFKLLSKDAKDEHRVYQGTIPDPTGKKPPLEIRLEVSKDELDTLDPMDDPNVHVVLYSGHSSLGGNGHQSIEDGPEKMIGKHPKLYFAANCRGKDNYSAFCNKYPDAHVIMTEHPTYSVSGQERVRALFDTLSRGESYAYMRKTSDQAFWDEPANNYFYPDEWRKFQFMDADQDGKFDFSPVGTDRLFDVDIRDAAGKFVRAVNFANSELFYHWEVELELGKKSYFGRKYGDALVPDGMLKDPKPGELIRLEPLKLSKTSTRFAVKFNPELAKKYDPNVYAGLVMHHVGLELAKHKTGSISQTNALRAALMGAQACHYLDVYEDTSPVTYKNYFAELGLTQSMKEADLELLFKKYDSHANDAQTKAFGKMLEDKYAVDLGSWHASLLATPA